MKGMIGRGNRARVDPAFDRFLQAPFDDDRHEQLLTVVSVLARLDLDPWHEAAVLAALSPAAAIDRLTALFEKVPDVAAVVPRDLRRIASRLVGLLPQSRPPAPVGDDGPIEGEDRSEPIERAPAFARRSWLKTVAIVVLLIIVAISTYANSPLASLFGAGSPGPAAATSNRDAVLRGQPGAARGDSLIGVAPRARQDAIESPVDRKPPPVPVTDR
jgi:hypothetical protein|nr:hypothetical protein [Panacagrimonas sp.]